MNMDEYDLKLEERGRAWKCMEDCGGARRTVEEYFSAWKSMEDKGAVLRSMVERGGE